MFLLPLTFSSFLIILTHSFFNAGLARLPSPEIYLSSFAVARSLMHIFQSPIMMTRQTVTSIANDPKNYRKTRTFLILIFMSVTATLAVIALTGASRWIFGNLMGLEGSTLDASVTMLKVLIIFPCMVGIRGFFSGICIKFRVMPLISAASLMRLIYVAVFISFIDTITFISPAVLAALMFLGAITTEVIVMVTGTKMIVKNIPKSLGSLNERHSVNHVEALTFKALFAFFAPLAITAYIQTLSMPIINGGLARTVEPEIALSVFSVAWYLGAVFLSPFSAFHQLPIRFIGEDGKRNIRSVRRFAILTGSLISLVMLLVSITDIGYFILVELIGTSHEISILSADVLKIMSLLPVIMVMREFIWGVMMKRRLTRYIGKGKIVNLSFLLIIVLSLTLLTFSNPALIGAIAVVGSEAAETVYLYIVTKKI